MKIYQIKASICRNCKKINDPSIDMDDIYTVCENCPCNVDNTYHYHDDIVFTMTYEQLLNIPKKEHDEVTASVLQILRIAEQVGKEKSQAEYELALKGRKFGTIAGIEFLPNRIRPYWSLLSHNIPRAFSVKKYHKPIQPLIKKAFRILIQDKKLTKLLNEYEILDTYFGPKKLPFSKHWDIWEMESLRGNLKEEAEPLIKKRDHAQ